MTVSRANLSGNGISHRGSKPLATLLRLGVTALQYLDLSRNKLGAAGAVLLAQSLEQNVSRLARRPRCAIHTPTKASV